MADFEQQLEAINNANQADRAGERGTVVLARPAIRHLISEVEQLSNSDAEQVAKFALDTLKPRAAFYGEEIIPLARLLSEIYQANDRFYEAAKVMAQVDLSHARNTTPAFKAEWFISTAELFNAASDTVSASSCISVAQRDMAAVEDAIVILRFKTLHAIINDSERKFLEAASKYIELSQMSASGLVSEESLMKSLENAITCAVLAKAGANRARLLATLYRDERSARLPNYRILEKMYKERILRPSEVVQFEEMLQPHQKATLAGGITVLKAAVNEHNMLAASKIYKNIRFSELGALLDLSAEQSVHISSLCFLAEQVAWRMIEEGRLKAVLDQVEGLLEFENNSDSFHIWDNQIAGICLAINEAVERAEKINPEKYSI